MPDPRARHRLKGWRHESTHGYATNTDSYNSVYVCMCIQHQMNMAWKLHIAPMCQFLVGSTDNITGYCRLTSNQPVMSGCRSPFLAFSLSEVSAGGLGPSPEGGCE